MNTVPSAACGYLSAANIQAGDRKGGPTDNGPLPTFELQAHIPRTAAISLPRSVGALHGGTVESSPQPIEQRPARRLIDGALPQSTAEEVKRLVQAVADAPARKGWSEVAGEAALAHVKEKSRLQIRLQPDASASITASSPPTADYLWGLLDGLGFPAIHLLHVVLYLAQHEREVTVSLDDLLLAIRYSPETGAERDVMRLQVWKWLCFFDAAQVVGTRKGVYKDPATGEALDTSSCDALIRITGTTTLARATGQSGRTPLEVTFVAGPWLDRLRGNRQVLTDFGDLAQVLAIPSGKPSGAWAHSVSLALNQRWREMAASAEIGRSGDTNNPTARFKSSLTRRELLGMFPCSIRVEDLLTSKNPARARKYWDEAILLLRHAGVVGWYAELSPLPDVKKGWAKSWLDQPLDIRPTASGVEAISQIARRNADTHRKSRKAFQK